MSPQEVNPNSSLSLAMLAFYPPRHALWPHKHGHGLERRQYSSRPNTSFMPQAQTEERGRDFRTDGPRMSRTQGTYFLPVRREVATRQPHETTFNLVLPKKTQRGLRASGYMANLREPASEGQIPSSDQYTTISVSFEHTLDDKGELLFIKAGMKMSKRHPHWALSASLEVCFCQVDPGILSLVQSRSC